MEKFEIKFNESADTYGTLIGMTAEEEKALVVKLDSATQQFRADESMNNSGQLLKLYLEQASTPEEAILAAWHAGVNNSKMSRLSNPLLALAAALSH